MTISELICRLQAIKCEHGDLIVHIGMYNRDVKDVGTDVFYPDDKNKDEKRCVIREFVNRKW